MNPVGYQPGAESMWWWKLAKHLDDAQAALANAMAHNLDDQAPVLMLQDCLNGGQAVLLEIFRSKGMLPAAPATPSAPVVQDAVLVPPPAPPQPFLPPQVIVGTVSMPGVFTASKPPATEADADHPVVISASIDEAPAPPDETTGASAEPGAGDNSAP